MSGLIGVTVTSLLYRDEPPVYVRGGGMTLLARLRDLSSQERDQLFNKLFLFSFKMLKPIVDRAKFLSNFDELIEESGSDTEFVKQVARLYDSLKDVHDVKKNDKRIRRRVDDILQMVGQVKPSRILDVGCADGSTLHALKSHYKLDTENVIGVDILDIVPDGFVFYKVKDDKLPLEDASVDLVTMLMVAHHLTEPNTMLQEIRRVLKPGGSLVIREHDVSSKWAMDPLFLDVTHMLYDCVLKDPRQTPTQWFQDYFAHYKRKDEWLNIFKRNGLRLVRQQGPSRDDIFRAFYAVFTVNH
jgi:ubiquinone/menaquinone biosynthesis C-methylase UbiE